MPLRRAAALTLALVLVKAQSAPPSTAANSLTTVVGPPEIVGGPTCCLFDSPFNAILSAGVTLGYTANSRSYILTEGSSVDATLPSPSPVGLGPDTDPASYAHCGRWLNAAVAVNATTVLGFFHQEWRCDYAANEYTNKSVGYGVSTDGGRTFTIPSPGTRGNQVIASGNATSTTSETGEGDHGVLRLGDWLYLFFLEWASSPSIHGGTSLGVARSAVVDLGVPGSWYKWHDGGWGSPGVGGAADTVGATGTAVYPLPLLSTLLSVGVVFSDAPAVAYSDAGAGDGEPGTVWHAATAGPLFAAGRSSWDREANSSELFGYVGLSAPQGTGEGLPVDSLCYVYSTYLAPGTDFTHRWLLRRPLRFFNGSAPWGGAPPSLEALSVWTSNSTTRPTSWSTTGPVPPDAGYTLTRPGVALVATWAPPSPAPPLLALLECASTVHAQVQPGLLVLRSAVVVEGECGAGAFEGWTLLRPAGWVARTQTDAAGLGWAAVSVPGHPPGSHSATPAALWRCVARAPDGNATDYTVALGGSAACDAVGEGYTGQVELGWALEGLQFDRE